MAHKRNPMKLTGFDWDDNNGYLSDTPKPLDHEMPYSDDRSPSTLAAHKPQYVGMPITVKAFLEMIKRYKDNKGLENVYPIVFSKASLMRILSQEKCEYIAFYFCSPSQDINIVSLCQQGLKSNMHPIKEPVFLNTANEITSYPTKPKLRKNAPNLEERGHGGQIAASGDTEGMILNVQELFEKNDKESGKLVEMPLQEFFSKLFKYVAAQYLPDEDRDNDEEDKD
jgi:hypothetical protein